MSIPVVDLLGFHFHNVTETQCVEHILGALRQGRGGWVVTPNLDILRLLATRRGMWDWFRQADLIVADGMPIVWLSRALGSPLPERVAGSSLVSSLSAGAAREGRSLFLLGGDPGAAEAAAEELRRRHPATRIAGIYSPPMGFEQDPAELERIRRLVGEARPDIVYVALGCPKQERLISHVRPCAPHAWYLGVGISLSYLAGTVKWAPPWMRKMGLEWVFRLAQDPARLARRYLREDVPFALRVAGLAAWARIRRGAPGLANVPRLAPKTPRAASR
jgi:N-acetylglucosaminyldiphosphoundecaprenol N-acetyl-beta-D-mannosaminyltransferase